jgi:hypothetical protein
MLLARRWWCGRHFLFSGNNSGAREKERVSKATRFFTANALWCSPRGGVSGGLRRGVVKGSNGGREVKTLSKMNRGITHVTHDSMHPCSNALSFATTTKSVRSFCARRKYFHRPRRGSFRFFTLSLFRSRARKAKTALYF